MWPIGLYTYIGNKYNYFIVGLSFSFFSIFFFFFFFFFAVLLEVSVARFRAQARRFSIFSISLVWTECRYMFLKTSILDSLFRGLWATQPAITFPKLAIEILEQGVKFVQS